MKKLSIDSHNENRKKIEVLIVQKLISIVFPRNLTDICRGCRKL